MKSLLTYTVLTSLALPLSAQVLTPPTNAGSLPGAGSNNAGNSNSGPSNTTINRYESSAPSAQGEEIPLVDPTAKTVEFQGRTYSLTDNNLGGQFEAFLASTEFQSKEATEYRELITKILDLLSPLNPGGPDRKSAYALLEEAAEYPGDGNVCSSLASSVYSGLLAMQGQGDKKVAIAKLQEEKKRLVYNMGILEKKGELGGTSTVKEGKKETKTKLATSTEYQVMKKRIVEIDAIIKKYEASGIIAVTQSKVQYQAMMVQLFIQRRFEHVVMAARFYNIIYKDGDVVLRIKKGSDTEKFFSEGIGVHPTVAGLDAAANEAIRKSKTLVDAFENNLNSNRVHAASERLVEAYAIGEFMPVVQTISNGKKERIQQYVQDANDLIEALSAKNLAIASELNESLKKQATDYNPSKASSYIAGQKRASDGYVRDAKFALASQDMDRAKFAIENALRHWPSNPAIGKFNEMLDSKLTDGFEAQDEVANATKKFDQLISNKNYRSIMSKENAVTFAAVFRKTNDEDRMAKLEEIEKSITEIETALKTSEKLVAGGQYYAAWEAIYDPQERYYDDIKIANAKAQLSGKVSDFTKALSEAERLESSGSSPHTGSALSWYLRAQEIYPGSSFAEAGIQRILEKQFKAQD